MEEKKDYRKELFYEKKNGYDLMDKELSLHISSNGTY